MKKVLFSMSLVIFLTLFIACKKETIITTPETKNPCLTEKLSSTKASVNDGTIIHYSDGTDYVTAVTVGGVSVGLISDGQKFTAGQMVVVEYRFIERVNNFGNGWSLKPFHELVLCEKGGILFERHVKKY